MVTVTIPKKEYQRLLDRTLRYEYLHSILQKDIFSPPPMRDTKEILKAFRATKKYNKNFLESLQGGLGRSSYFKQ